MGLQCQICLIRFLRVKSFRRHIRSFAHQQKLKDIFPKDVIKCSGPIPCIVFLDPSRRQDVNNPVIGVSLLTLCFNPDTRSSFYLCHVCNSKCEHGQILQHLFSVEHYNNYFSYKNPNRLKFSWVPSKATIVTLLTTENSPEDLQILHLPRNLVEKHKSSTYAEVMDALSENDKLLKQIKASYPERMTIQTYQKDTKRENPLLGMQHLVECVCVGPAEKRYYLCTLCKLTVATHVIITHVLSFDHIFCYFTAWHPSTLQSKGCYREHLPNFRSTMLNLSKQAEEIHRTANTDLKQVSLEPAEYESVDFTCYAEALKKLESIKKCSLTTSIKPGEKLALKKLESIKKCSLTTSIKPGEKLVHSQSSVHAQPSVHSQPSVFAAHPIRCQNCSNIFYTEAAYTSHLSTKNHKMKLKKFFGEAEGVGSFDQSGDLYLALPTDIECSRKPKPVIGTSLVVTCISTGAKVEPIHTCFACQDSFPQSFLLQHFTSRKHLIHTLLYLNPWRLPFAWKDHLDDTELWSIAEKEEKERPPSERNLKVLHIPYRMYLCLHPPSFGKVMETLELHHTLLKREVPRCETYSKLQENERFPLLGKQFLVMHDACFKGQSPQKRFLCLLCERRLSEEEGYGHVFSWEHVVNFLKCFHPGSLNPSTEKPEILLDLAKQAARIHPIMHIQVINMNKPIWEPCSYRTAINVLNSAKMRSGQGKLEPPITPTMKLVPRKTLTEVEDCAKANSQKTSSNTNTLSVENRQSAEKGDDKETPTTSAKESEIKREELSKTSSEEIKDAGETCQVVEEKTEESTTREACGEIQDSCQEKDKSGAECVAEISKTSEDEKMKEEKDAKTNDMHKSNTRKRPNSMSEELQEDLNPDEELGRQMDHKRQRLLSKEDSCEESLETPNSGLEEEDTAAVEESHEPAVEKAPQTMKAQQDRGHELPSASAWPCVKPVDPFITLDIQHGVSHMTSNLQEVDMEIDRDSDKSEEVSDMPVMNETTSKTAQVLPESNEDETMRNVKVPHSAENSHHCLSVPRSNKHTVDLNVSSVTNTACWSADSNANGSKDDITPDTAVESFNVATSSKTVQMGAAASICSAATANYTAASSKHSGVTSSLDTTSNTESTTVSRPSESRTEVPSQTKVSHRGSTVVREATCRPASSSKTDYPPASRTTVVPQVKVPCATTAKMPKTSVSRDEASATSGPVKNSAGANADNTPHVSKNNPPAAPQLTSATSVSSEHMKPPHPSANKTNTSEMLPEVGLNQLIKVSWDVKRQVYCLLCGVRLNNSGHTSNIDHCFKYVKMIYPTSKLDAKHPDYKNKLIKIATLLAEADKDAGSQEVQCLRVKEDVYKKLAALPPVKAIERVKQLMAQRDKLVSPPSTPDAAEPVRGGVASFSPCDVSSSDDVLGQEERLSLNVKDKPSVEVTPVIENHGVTVEKPRSCPKPLVTNSEARDPCGDAPDDRQKQQTGGPDVHDTQRSQECTQTASHVEFVRPDPHSQDTTGKSEQQNLPRPGHQGEDASTNSPDLVKHNPSEALPSILIAEKTQGRSHLSRYLNVLGQDAEPIIGLEFVWECRGISGSGKPLYLCESCDTKVICSEITKHLCSSAHKFLYMRKHKPQILSMFWTKYYLTEEMKLQILNEVAGMLSQQERFHNIDAQGILLGKKLYDDVCSAPFNKALEIVQNIKNEQKLSAACPSISVPQQRKEVAGGVEVGKERKVSSPAVDCSSSKDRSVVSPVSSVNPGLIPQETCSRLSMHPESTALVSEQQRSVPRLEVTQAEMNSESPSLLNPNIDQTLSVSSTDQHLPTRKRPVDTSIETLASPVTNSPLEGPLPSACPVPRLEVTQAEMNSESPSLFNLNIDQTLSVSSTEQHFPTRKRPVNTSVETLAIPLTNSPLEGPLPAKYTHNTLQPISEPSSEYDPESTYVDPAVNMSPEDFQYLSYLISQIKSIRSQKNVSPDKPTTSNEQTINSCATASADSEEMISDSESIKTQSVNQKSCDSESQIDKNRMKENPPCTRSLEGTFLTEEPVGSGCENQPVTSQDNSVCLAVSSSSEASLMSGNPQFGAPEEKSADAIVPATTDHHSNSQHPQCATSQNIVGNMNQSASSQAATSTNSGQIPQPQEDTGPDTSAVGQLPISTIITARPDPLSMTPSGTPAAYTENAPHMLYAPFGQSFYFLPPMVVQQQQQQLYYSTWIWRGDTNQ